MSDSLIIKLAPGASVEEFLVAISALAASATFDSVISAYLEETEFEARKALFMAGLVACRSVKKLVQKLEGNTGKIAKSFTVEGGPNMTMLAMLGHLTYCSSATWSPLGQASYSQYKATIGDNRNIFAFSGSVAGKEKRTEVLKQTAGKAKPSEQFMREFNVRIIEDFPIMFSNLGELTGLSVELSTQLEHKIYVAAREWNADSKHSANQWDIGKGFRTVPSLSWHEDKFNLDRATFTPVPASTSVKPDGTNKGGNKGSSTTGGTSGGSVSGTANT